MKNLFLLILFMVSVITKVTFANSLDEAINNSDRTPLFAERDIYRNPKETLQFFGIKNDMSVIELWPSRGWYSEILEPFLSSKEHFWRRILILIMLHGRLKSSSVIPKQSQK